MIKIIGMGPGAVECMTNEAIKAVMEAERVIAFGRIAKTAKLLVDGVIEVESVKEIIKNVAEGGITAILASGDPGFYGVIDYLERKGLIIDEVIPGISSMQYMMAKLRRSWQEAQLISLHGRSPDLSAVMSSKISILLTDAVHTPDYISRLLYKEGLSGKLYTGYNLSYEDEKIIINNIGDEIELISNISVVVIENEMA